MRVIGIDPGYDRIGIAIVDKEKGQKEVLFHSECLQTNVKDSIYERFEVIGRKIAAIIEECEPEALSIENLFITKNQKTAMRVSEARGIIIYEALKHDLPVFEYSPMEIKTSITGDGGSDKARMIKMVCLLIKIDAKKRLDDEYDAIAVALAHLARVR